MKREIKFRGLRTDGKGWVYGDLLRLVLGGNIHLYIQPLDTKRIEVIPESVGQFTGLNDTNGIEIFEDDDVNVLSMNINRKVYFNKCAFGININEDIFSPIYQSHDLEITGNIHEKI